MNIPEVGAGFGSGGVAGFGLGFIGRKAWSLALKIVGALVGFQMAFMYWLESEGIATFNWSALYQEVGQVTDTAVDTAGTMAGYLGPFANAMLSVLPVGAGFMTGAMAGWYMGK